MSSSSSIFFNNCCCCIDLRTGCLILGFLNLIGVITSLLAVGVGLVYAGFFNEDLEFNELPLGLTISLYAFIINLVLAFVFNIVLLVGLYKNKPGHVKAYLIYNTILLVIGAVSTFIVLALFYSPLLATIVTIVQTSISAYFLLVIRSYYTEMKRIPYINMSKCI